MSPLPITPTIEWRGCPPTNYLQGRQGKKPVAIVCHIMQGTIESAEARFHDPTAEVSTHYGIARDGRVYQWAHLRNTAYGNGVVNAPNLAIPWLAQAVAQKQWLNPLTISIEHEGFSGEQFTPPMYRASLWLIRRLTRYYGIPCNRQHVIGHGEIDSVGRGFCPGAAFPWEELIADLKGRYKIKEPIATVMQSAPLTTRSAI